MPIERLQILLSWYPPTATQTTEDILGEIFEWARLSAAQPTAVAALPADFLLHVARYYQLQVQVGATPTTLLPRHGSSTIWRATMARGHGDTPIPIRENITTDEAMTAAEATRPWEAPALCIALLPSGGLPNTQLSLMDLELLHQRARATAQAGLTAVIVAIADKNSLDECELKKYNALLGQYGEINTLTVPAGWIPVGTHQGSLPFDSAYVRMRDVERDLKDEGGYYIQRDRLLAPTHGDAACPMRTPHMGHNATVQIIVYAPHGRVRPCRAAMIAFRNGTLSNLINRISTDGRAISPPIHE